MSAHVKWIEKLWRSDELRPTRFHTQDGRLVGVRGLLEFPASLLSYGLLRVFGFRFGIPWWTWSAIAFVGRRLTSKDGVLEDGSGMSTLWLARRCARVVSFEESPEWRAEVLSRASALRLTNVSVLTGNSAALLQEVTRQDDFSVIVVDGPGDRLALFDAILRLDHVPRIVIFDNSDRPDNHAAKQMAQQSGYLVKSFRGFPPTLVNATETSVFFLPEAES